MGSSSDSNTGFEREFEGVSIALLTAAELEVLKKYLQARKMRVRREEDIVDLTLEGLQPGATMDSDSAHAYAMHEASLAQAIEAEQKARAAWKRVRLEVRTDRMATAAEDKLEAITTAIDGGLSSLVGRITEGPVGAIFEGLRRSDRPAKSDEGSKPGASQP